MKPRGVWRVLFLPPGLWVKREVPVIFWPNKESTQVTAFEETEESVEMLTERGSE